MCFSPFTLFMIGTTHFLEVFPKNAKGKIISYIIYYLFNIYSIWKASWRSCTSIRWENWQHSIIMWLTRTHLSSLWWLVLLNYFYKQIDIEGCCYSCPLYAEKKNSQNSCLLYFEKCGGDIYSYSNNNFSSAHTYWIKRQAWV